MTITGTSNKKGKIMMKKIVFILAVMAISVSTVFAAQVGVPLTVQIPQHGHSSPYDGGVLKNTYTVLSTSGVVTVNSSTTTTIPWDVETLDSLKNHSNTVNNTRVSVPFGYTLAVAQCSFIVSKSASSLTVDAINIYKNGVLNSTITFQWPSVALIGVSSLLSNTAYITVTTGDYLECGYVNGDNANSILLQKNNFNVVLYR
jgi:hypothetical protein